MKDSKVLFLKAINGAPLYLSLIIGRKATFIFANLWIALLRWLFFIYCMMLTFYEDDGRGCDMGQRLERKEGRQAGLNGRLGYMLCIVYSK